MKLFKKYIIMFLFIVIVPVKLFAVDFSAGPLVWYSWWTPYQSAGVDEFEMSPGILYGGAFSVSFNNAFSIGLSGFKGSFTADYKNKVTFADATTASLNWNDIKISRTDIDLTFTYRIFDYLKAYGGIKYQQYDFSGKGTFTASNGDTGFLDSSGDPDGCQQFGFGAGLGSSFPVTDSMSISGTVSYLLLATDFSPVWISKSGTTVQQYSERPRVRGTAQGGNVVMLYSYFYDSINTTFSIGYRFQMLHFSTSPELEGDDGMADTGDQSLDVYDGTTEYFHGIMIYALYRF